MTRPAVLLVDDQPANLTSFEALLDDFDIRLLSASSGQQALKILLEDDIAVMLLDVQMPDMDGYEVASLMKKWTHTRDVPIIFVTAINRDIQHILRGYETGAVDFLTKPIEPEVLRSKIRVFLELNSKRRALADSLARERRLKDHNELLLRSVGEGIFSVTADGVITYANPEAQALLGIADSLVGLDLDSLFHGEEATKQLQSMYRQCRAGEKWRRVLSCKRHDDSFPAELIATPMYGEEESLAGISLILQDVSARQEREMSLRAESEQDPLTHLANRRGLERELKRRLAEAPDQQALLLLELDRFESVHEKLGQQASEAVLCQIAGRLRRAMRESDLVARTEGDNFCLLVSAPDPQQAAIAVANKVLKTAADPVHFGDVPLRLSASVGIALAASQSTPGGLMHRADQVLAMARRSGGNQYALAGRDTASTGQASG